MSNSDWNRTHVGSKQSLLILTLESHQMMIIGVEVRYRTWVPVVVFDTPACNGWKSSWGGPIFDKNTRGVVLVAPGPTWDALRVIPGGIILIPEVSF